MRAHRLHVLLKRRARCGLLWRCATFRQLRRRRGLSLKLAPALRMRGCYRGRFDCGAGVRQRQAWPGARGRSRKWVVRRACRASVGRRWASGVVGLGHRVSGDEPPSRAGGASSPSSFSCLLGCRNSRRRCFSSSLTCHGHPRSWGAHALLARAAAHGSNSLLSLLLALPQCLLVRPQLLLEEMRL